MANKAGSFAHLLEAYYKLGKSEDPLPLKTDSVANGGKFVKEAIMFYVESHSFSPFLDLIIGICSAITIFIILHVFNASRETQR